MRARDVAEPLRLLGLSEAETVPSGVRECCAS